jgi:hypothetical protein
MLTATPVKGAPVPMDVGIRIAVGVRMALALPMQFRGVAHEVG